VTGRPVRASGIRIDRFANARIAESWLGLDALGLLRKLGALPVPRHDQGEVLTMPTMTTF
jgi:hypothetical protein